MPADHNLSQVACKDLRWLNMYACKLFYRYQVVDEAIPEEPVSHTFFWLIFAISNFVAASGWLVGVGGGCGGS